MAITTIEWTWRRLPEGMVIQGYTFNPWWGCHKVSQECKHCYAEGIAARYGHRVWGPAATTARRFFGAEHWREPLHWNAQAAREGHRRNVFCASMADVFEEHPAVDEARIQLWRLIEATPWLNWLPALQWVICGGESGARARPMWPAWARSLREQCQAAAVPYFFKQWGGRTHSAGGRELDGRTWDEMPPAGPVPAMCGQTLV